MVNARESASGLPFPHFICLSYAIGFKHDIVPLKMEYQSTILPPSEGGSRIAAPVPRAEVAEAARRGNREIHLLSTCVCAGAYVLPKRSRTGGRMERNDLSACEIIDQLYP
jgi:hypothetical protein